MSVDILGTSWDQCRSMVQYSFTSTETRRLVRTDSPGRPPQLSHSSWTMTNLELGICRLYRYSMEGTQHISQRYWSQRPLLVPLNSKLAQCSTIMGLTAVDTTLVSCTRYKKCNNMPVQRQTGSWRSLPIESEIPRSLFFFLITSVSAAT